MQDIGTNEIRGLDGCTLQPRGGREATMEEGEVQISFLLPQLFHFLVEIARSGK